MAGWATKIEGNTIGLSVPYDARVREYVRTHTRGVSRLASGACAQIIPWNFRAFGCMDLRGHCA